jgi:hypothetical protein
MQQVAKDLTPEEMDSLTPLAIIMIAARAEFTAGDLRAAVALAEKAAPYVHARGGVEVSATQGLPPELRPDGLCRAAIQCRRLTSRDRRTRSTSRLGIPSRRRLKVEAGDARHFGFCGYFHTSSSILAGAPAVRSSIRRASNSLASFMRASESRGCSSRHRPNCRKPKSCGSHRHQYCRPG